MKVEKVVSEVVFNVISNGTKSTNKPSQVTMVIPHRLAPKASELFLDLKENIQPEKGLIGFKLMAVYADGVSPEQQELPMNEESQTSPDNIHGAFKGGSDEQN